MKQGTQSVLPGSAPPVPRCGECWACQVERIGCACDGAMDDGCFLCTPARHKRPPCLRIRRGAARVSKAALAESRRIIARSQKRKPRP